MYLEDLYRDQFNRSIVADASNGFDKFKDI